MEIEKCDDYELLTDVWLASVKATHDFLDDDDLEYYHRKLPVEYMPNVELYAIKNGRGEWAAFVGLSADMVEMLFVHPCEMGKGYGSRLLRFAVNDKGRRKVDVNEQNIQALEFYLGHGFSVIGRDAVDCEGKPYPIVHLEMKK